MSVSIACEDVGAFSDSSTNLQIGIFMEWKTQDGFHSRARCFARTPLHWQLAGGGKVVSAFVFHGETCPACPSYVPGIHGGTGAGVVSQLVLHQFSAMQKSDTNTRSYTFTAN